MSKPILIEFNRKVACVKEHCKDLNVSYSTVKARHYRTGESYEECLNYYQENDVNLHSPMIKFNGKIASLSEHCKDLGLNYSTVRSRHYRTGEPYEKCLEYYQENGLYNYVHGERFSSLINFNGKVACIAEHCRDLGIDSNTLWSRKHRTGESDLECLEYYQKNGVRHINSKYKVKDKRLYSRWHNAKDRCENPKNPYYYRYGGRGIKVCERWQDYENFENDLLESFLEHVERYGIKDTTLERNNYDGDYEPSNCTWATRLEQAKNKHKRISKYYLPCNKSLRQHCIINNYDYFSVVRYIKKYNLQPHQALAGYLKNKQKNT